MYYDNMVTHSKFIGYGMKKETPAIDSPNIDKACKISLTTALNTLCGTLPMFCVDNNTRLHYDCLCLMQSRFL